MGETAGLVCSWFLSLALVAGNTEAITDKNFAEVKPCLKQLSHCHWWRFLSLRMLGLFSSVQAKHLASSLGIKLILSGNVLFGRFLEGGTYQ